MLKPRIIPCLLIRDKGLVKTIKFKNDQYVGDPINAVKIFNEKLVDELMVVDIDSTTRNQPPNYELIKKIAAESQMPICYAGGIKTAEQVKEIIGFGVEKIGISSALIKDINLVKEASKEVGSQSIVAILDVKKSLFGNYSVLINNGKTDTKRDLFNLIDEILLAGAGEIVINSIDRDGTMQGYDIDLLERLKDKITVPLTFLGGAGNHSHISSLFKSYGIVGAGVGSLFVFKGQYKAVLINYPNPVKKEEIFSY